jgi:hypothetical protein
MHSVKMMIMAIWLKSGEILVEGEAAVAAERGDFLAKAAQAQGTHQSQSQS